MNLPRMTFQTNLRFLGCKWLVRLDWLPPPMHNRIVAAAQAA